MKSIETAQMAAKKQLSPLKSSMKMPALQKDGDDDSSIEELGLSTQQFRFLSKNLSIGLASYKIVYDKEGVPVDAITLEVNPEYEKTICIKRKHLIGKPMADYLQKITASNVDWVAVFGRVGTTCIPEHFEVRFPINQKLYQIYVFSPKKGYCFSSFRDVTVEKKKARQEVEERKRAKLRLISAEKRYRSLFMTTQDGIMARDINGKMINCNQAYAKMLGYTKKELKNLSVMQLLPEKCHEQRERVAQKVLRTGRSIVFEREYLRKDGSTFPASVRTWRLTDSKGQVVGIWSIVREISEQKKLQKDLEEHAGLLEKIVEDRTKQLKDTERLVAIGQTAGMVGHDLRNPLQTVIGELYLAKCEVESFSEGEAKSSLTDSIHVIEEQVGYMDKIISDLQAFVQPVRLDKVTVNLKKLITSVLTVIIIPNEVTVDMQCAGTFSQIKADPQLLKRVLFNLVTNALQAMPNGGILTLTVQDTPSGFVSICVKDTGVGIPDRIKSQIFTPLFTTKPRGQGFGLAVCKRVIEAHGGIIRFKSVEGKGTKFTLKLPKS